jgi:hypothetical protein
MSNGADVLTVTAGGTVPEFHRLACQLSPRLPSGTPACLFSCIYRVAPGRGLSQCRLFNAREGIGGYLALILLQSYNLLRGCNYEPS